MTQRAAADAPPSTSPVGGVNGVHPTHARLLAPSIPEPADRHLVLRGGEWQSVAPTGSVVEDAMTDPRSTDRVAVAPNGRHADPTCVAPDQSPPTGRPSVAPNRSVAKAVAPLVLVNALAVYGQLAYVYSTVAPAHWLMPAKVALSVGAAAAVESIALYVGWHAHDALLLGSHTTARWLRRASYLVAALVASVNYAHFAAPSMRPTAAAIMFGLVSLVSPWLWGLHTRRAQHIQLLRESLADEAGVEFSAKRRRRFPVRTWRAESWAIEHNVRSPYAAWDGYNTERSIRSPQPVVTPPTVKQSVAPRPTADRPTGRPNRRAKKAAAPTVRKRTAKTEPTDLPTVPVVTPQPSVVPTVADTDRSAPTEHSPAAVDNARSLRLLYPTGLTDSDYAAKKKTGWSHSRFANAKAAYLAGADLTQPPNGATS